MAVQAIVKTKLGIQADEKFAAGGAKEDGMRAGLFYVHARELLQVRKLSH